MTQLLSRPLQLIGILSTACVMAACASSAPSGPQITPVNATVKLGRVTEKTFLTRIDVANPNDSGYGVGVGAAGVGGGGGGGGGGGVGVGFSMDLTRLFNRQPPQQMDLYQYKVRAADGTMAQVNAPAAPGLEPGACVRLIYPDGSTQPQMAPSNEC
ncbi:MAG: hypothetical protein AAB280_13150 [Pseudomonadota bacterium]